MRSLIVILLIVSTLNVQAQFLGGHDRGNGGDVLVCYDSAGKITSAKFYDLFEAEVKFGMTLIPPQGNTLDEKVDSIISRVEKIDPSRAWAFRKWYKDFFQESKFIPGVELGDIPDQGDALWPVNCKIKQLVVQTDVKPPLNPHRYTFSQDLWNLLDDNSKVATIIHELIYREARSMSHESSQAVRYLNGLFWADQLNQQSLIDYIRLIFNDLKLAIVTDAKGVPVFKGGSHSFYQSLKGLPFIFLGFEFEFDGNSYSMCQTVNDNGICRISHNTVNSLKKYELPNYINSSKIHTVEFQNGALTLKGEFILNFLNIKIFQFVLVNEKLWEIKLGGDFYEHDKIVLNTNQLNIINGHYFFKKYILELNSTVQIEMIPHSRFKRVSYSPDKSVEFDKDFFCRSGQQIIIEDGNKLSCVLEKDVKFRHNNKFVIVKAGTRVLVNSNLELIKVQ